MSGLIHLLEGTTPAARLQDLLGKFRDIGNTVKSVYDVSLHIFYAIFF